VAKRSALPKDLTMQKLSLSALAREQLELARAASSGRSAATVYGGHEHVLRQTLIAIVEGRRLDEHGNPGEATVHVLHGRVTLRGAGQEWNGSPGDLIIVPDSVHSLEAVEDSAVLLTVAKTR
jgi:quercetin dioxygenase-like cupin family protein